MPAIRSAKRTPTHSSRGVGNVGCQLAPKWDPRQTLGEAIVETRENVLGAGRRFAPTGIPPQAGTLVGFSTCCGDAKWGPTSKHNSSMNLLTDSVRQRRPSVLRAALDRQSAGISTGRSVAQIAEAASLLDSRARSSNFNQAWDIPMIHGIRAAAGSPRVDDGPGDRDNGASPPS